MSAPLAQLLTGPVTRNGHVPRVIVLYSHTGAVLGALDTHQHNPWDDGDNVRAYLAAVLGLTPDTVPGPTTLPGLDVTAREIAHWSRVGEHRDPRLPFVTMYPDTGRGQAVCAYHSTRARARAWQRECPSLGLIVVTRRVPA